MAIQFEMSKLDSANGEIRSDLGKFIAYFSHFAASTAA